MKAQYVVQRAQTADLRLVRFLYCDNGGIIRGKATHTTKLATRMQEGIGQIEDDMCAVANHQAAGGGECANVGEFHLSLIHI